MIIKGYNMHLKPILTYPGSKTKEIPLFESYFPKQFNNYFEPFAGSAAAFFYLNRNGSYLNDNSSDLIHFYLFLKLYPKEVTNSIDNLCSIYDSLSMDDKKRFYYSTRSSFNTLLTKAQRLIKTDKIRFACDYYILNKLAFSGMIRKNKLGEDNISFGFRKHLANTITSEHLALLSKATITKGDYRNVLTQSGNNDFVFLDPPYDSTFTNYAEPFGHNKQVELATQFKQAKSKCLIVIAETPFIRDLYKNYIVGSYQKHYQIMQVKGGRSNTHVTHLIVSNY